MITKTITSAPRTIKAVRNWRFLAARIPGDFDGVPAVAGEVDSSAGNDVLVGSLVVLSLTQ
jgi:hypothetical protein